jgi:hypothetical protein
LEQFVEIDGLITGKKSKKEYADPEITVPNFLHTLLSTDEPRYSTNISSKTARRSTLEHANLNILL